MADISIKKALTPEIIKKHLSNDLLNGFDKLGITYNVCEAIFDMFTDKGEVNGESITMYGIIKPSVKVWFSGQTIVKVEYLNVTYS